MPSCTPAAAAAVAPVSPAAAAEEYEEPEYYEEEVDYGESDFEEAAVVLPSPAPEAPLPAAEPEVRCWLQFLVEECCGNCERFL